MSVIYVKSGIYMHHNYIIDKRAKICHASNHLNFNT